jgi:hypothetical protein
MRLRSALPLVLLLALGCASAGAWKYEPVSRSLGPQPLVSSRVAVSPFEDRRPEGNSNKILLYLIPINPIGPFEYNQIEGGSGFLTHASYQVRPPEDLAKAIVSELVSANLFGEVFYTERRQEPGVDYFLQGYVDEFRYEGKIISYGLSAYGPLLWFLGLPSGHTKNSLSVSLDLRRAADGEVVWRSQPIRAERTMTSGLYYNWGREFDGYPIMMQDAARTWIDGLASFVRAKPPVSP